MIFAVESASSTYTCNYLEAGRKIPHYRRVFPNNLFCKMNDKEQMKGSSRIRNVRIHCPPPPASVSPPFPPSNAVPMGKTGYHSISRPQCLQPKPFNASCLHVLKNNTNKTVMDFRNGKNLLKNIQLNLQKSGNQSGNFSLGQEVLQARNDSPG